jgi:hypothetical protein
MFALGRNIVQDCRSSSEDLLFPYPTFILWMAALQFQGVQGSTAFSREGFTHHAGYYCHMPCVQ